RRRNPARVFLKTLSFTTLPYSMAAPVNKKPTAPPQSLWNYGVTVIVSALMGAAITWLFMSQSQKSMPPAQTLPIQAPLQTPDSAPPDVSRMSPGEGAVALGNFAYDHQRWPEAIR